jgi:hypothetical protein
LFLGYFERPMKAVLCRRDGPIPSFPEQQFALQTMKLGSAPVLPGVVQLRKRLVNRSECVGESIGTRQSFR